MLLELRISNFILIEHVHLEFNSGLTVFTGETGAGKSLLVKALNLLLGEKGGAQYIKPGKEVSEIEAIFSVNKALAKKLESMGYTPIEEIHLKRIISPQRQRCYFNGSPITLNELSLITRELISLTSQHEHYDFLNKERQLQLFDTYIGLSSTVSQYYSLYQEYKSLDKKLKELKENISKILLKRDFLLFQIREIEELNPQPEEEEGLLRQRERLRHLNFIREIIHNLELSSEEASIQLNNVLNLLQKILPFEPKLKERQQHIQELYYELKELNREIRGLLGDLPEDERGLEEVEARLAKYERIKKKYACSTLELLKLKERLKEELGLLDTSEEEVSQLEEKKAFLERTLMDMALKIREERLKGRLKLQEQIREQLMDLAMERAIFEVALREREALPQNLTAFGLDEIEFLFSSNPGVPPRSLDKIVSGGELSRIFLAFKSLIYDSEGGPTLLFDEVDTGIGGLTALKVGEKLKALAEKTQVICITHLPQIARFADHHFVVEKKFLSDSTETIIRKLSKEERLQELARMLGETENIELASKIFKQ
ncbi:MAG: DNA repair protein RecN [Caldimicrobium sp.]|nr:DNA repair protein RecN [Caldimicrobium sp.]MCX7874015.1 DNA repair protein RecN [Caldimicrobium sp.]MDW8094163.1 DNA repair protein RecN [Caldimicrobium sp.]